MLWALVVVIILAKDCYSQTNVTVTTSKGQVIGLRWDPHPKTESSYDAFIGIPYGQIPGRFQPSVPRSSWTTPLVTQTDGPPCPQPNVVFSEDCLYLNVFTPVEASTSSVKFPVMAFIHGSAFTYSSSSSSWYGPDFIVPHGVILVTMNYRLGAAGFLTLGSPLSPGNLGLLDTQLALGWIQEEISTFGGDPGQVTLVGQSAGSVMTMFHYLSPVSTAMFQRAVAHSGSALSTWGLISSTEAVRRAKMLADAVGCDSTQNDTLILTCLQQKDISIIVNHQNITLPVEDVASANQLPFVPVFDVGFGKPPFFADSIENQLKQAIVRSKPLITGFTSEEGILLFGYDSWKLAESNLKGFVPWSIRAELNDGQKTELGKKIESNYFPKTVDQNKVLDIVNLFTDYMFAYPTIEVIRQFSNFTYSYVFAYDGSWTPIPDYFKRFHVTGVYHGADLFYLFYYGQDLSPCMSNLPNLVVRDNMTSFWTNFVKTGIPDPSGLWNTASTGHYLLVDSTISYVNASDVEERRYNFWANLNASNLNNTATTIELNLLFMYVTCLCLVLK